MIIFLKYIITIIFVLFFSPLTFLVILLRPFVLIRFGNLEYKRIGHLALDTSIYLANKNLLSKKTIDFIGYSKKNTCNNQLIKIWKKQIKIYNFSFLFNILQKSLNFIFKSKIHSIKLYGLQKYSSIIKNRNFIFFDSDDLNKINYYSKKLNIDINTRWVCIHNRDNEYLKKTRKYITEKQLNNHNIRNFNIEDLNLASKYLIDKGYQVIRIGNIQENSIINSSDKFIDYSNSLYKNELMDIYLLSNCEFYIGSDSGIGNISVISNKFVGLINSTYYENLQIQSFKRFVIFKKFFSNKLNRNLSLKEIFKANLHTLSTTSEFDKNEIKLIDNSPEEIKNLSIEMDMKINGTWERSEEDTKFHNIFWDIIKYYDLEKNNDYEDIYLGNHYLKNNLYLIE